MSQFTKNIGGPQDDKASIITTDKLKRFNDINGYEHGPATKPLQTEEDEEAQDKVNELGGKHQASKTSLKIAGANALDGKSVISKILSKGGSPASKAPSAKSSLSKVFMRNLQKELDEEKQARLKLEREIAEIRKINTELSTTIGLMGK